MRHSHEVRVLTTRATCARPTRTRADATLASVAAPSRRDPRPHASGLSPRSCRTLRTHADLVTPCSSNEGLEASRMRCCSRPSRRGGCDADRGLHQGGRAGACPPPRCPRSEADATLSEASIREVGRGLVPRPGVSRTPRPLRRRRIRPHQWLIADREQARRGTSPRPTARTLRVRVAGSGWDPHALEHTAMDAMPRVA